MKLRTLCLLLASILTCSISLADSGGPKGEVDDIQNNDNIRKLSKPQSFADEAIGVMDKGQLQNLTMNWCMV